MSSGSSPDRRQRGRQPRRHARRKTRDRLADMGDVLGRGAAAATDDVDQSGLGKFAYQRCGLAGLLVVLAEGVRQAGIRIGADRHIGDARELLDIGAQLLRPERAVEPDHGGLAVADRIPEGLDRLPRERAAGGIGDRARDHDRQIDRQLAHGAAHGVQRRLGVERVEDGLQQDQVGPAFDQRRGRLTVGRHQLVEIDVAKTRIVDARRQRRGAIGGADRAGHEARLPGAFGVLVGNFARQARRRPVELHHHAFHAVVALGRRAGIEGIGLDDVGPGLQVLAVYLADHRRLRQRQQIVVALQIARPVVEALTAIRRLIGRIGLDHGAHGAVEHQDALAQQAFEFLDALFAAHARCSSGTAGDSAWIGRTPSA
jgi:hypothetical protein